MASDSSLKNLAGMTPGELRTHLSSAGIEEDYGTKLLYWIYKRSLKRFDDIDNIPKSVIAKLKDHFSPGLFGPMSSVVSDDGSVKYLFRNPAGLLYESVYIPDGRRHTLCVSVQSGCRMGCSFCATGDYGWHGNLAAAEIVNQVLSLPHNITHVVFMGMGEPCDNTDEVIKACNILTAEWGLAKGRTNITVSTVGIMSGLKRFLEETQCNITLSLHSPFPEERVEIIPAELLSPANELISVMKSFVIIRRRRFTVAYVMINGINDTDRHLDALKTLLSGSGIRVNLIPYHPLVDDTCTSSSHERMMYFKHILVTSGIGASVRRSRGSDVSAACGMLAALNRTTQTNNSNL